jgi:hypothetical protein
MSNLPPTSLKFIDIANAYNASGLPDVGTTDLKLSLFAGAVLTDGTTVPSSGPFNTSMFYGKTFGCRLGTDCSWNTVKAILDAPNVNVGYTVYQMKPSTNITPAWHILESTSTPLTGNPWGSTGEVHNGGPGGTYMEINGGLILVIDSSGDVIWKINTVGDNHVLYGGGGNMYVYNISGQIMSLSVEYINYNSAHFPFVNISDASASRPINGNSTSQSSIINDWYNGNTADYDGSTPLNSNRRIVDNFRNHLGLKWVFIHNKTTSQSRYDSMYATPGNLFINPVGIWPSYPYPTI